MADTTNNNDPFDRLTIRIEQLAAVTEALTAIEGNVSRITVECMQHLAAEMAAELKDLARKAIVEVSHG